MSKYIKKYSEFQKINELTEFNIQRFNQDSSIAAGPVVDPQISTTAYDRNQDMIRTSMSRINDIMFNLKGTSAYTSLRSKLLLDNQNITDLKILRIVKTSSLKYNAYISFIIDNHEYWGVIEDIMDMHPIMKSEVFKDYNLHQPKEWVIKIKGNLIKTIKQWLKPEPGKYVLLNDDLYCYSNESGKQLKMYKGIEIELIRSHNDKIIISYNNDSYNLVGDSYVYFNWWFEKLK